MMRKESTALKKMSRVVQGDRMRVSLSLLEEMRGELIII